MTGYERLVTHLDNVFANPAQPMTVPSEISKLLRRPVLVEAILASAGNSDRSDKSKYLLNGRVAMAEGHFGKAYRAFTKSLTLAPGNVEINVLLSHVCIRLGAPHLSHTYAEAALAIDAKCIDALMANSEALIQIGLLDDASVAVERLAHADSKGVIGPMMRLRLAIEQGDFECGLLELGAFFENNPSVDLARELFRVGFDSFKIKEPERFAEFIDSLDLSPLPILGSKTSAQIDDGTIDIVIPVHNSLSDLVSCLTSIRQWQETCLGRIIIVDDASDPETRDWILAEASRCSDITVVRQEESGGFTRSVGCGLKASIAPYAVLLNSDTVVTPGWMSNLWRALASDVGHALAGPLSNNGYFQTIFSDTTIVPKPEIAAARVLSNSHRLRPQIPLLSGFCMMVLRAAYDQVGGLDEDRFPRGYGEVQDLALRLRDAGYSSCLADDVYVHHSGGQSIGADRKQILIAKGFELNCARFGGVRFLAAESLSAQSDEVKHHRTTQLSYLEENTGDALSSTLTAHVPEGDVITRVPLMRSCAELITDDFLGREVCVFVAHAPCGIILSYTHIYLQELKKNGIYVIVCLTTDDLDMPIESSILDVADEVLVRENAGFDFGAWAAVLRERPALWDAARLYFLNDSVIGPFGKLQGIIESIRSNNAGFFGLSECMNAEYHVQSYFFGWNANNLGDEKLRAFWAAFPNFVDKLDVIFAGEHELSRVSSTLKDPTRQILFDTMMLFGVAFSNLPLFNPTHHGWKQMLAAGFPFVKTDLVRDGLRWVAKEPWRDIIESYGADGDKVMLHIEASRIFRSI